MAVKIEINGKMVEFASMSDAQKAYSAAQADIEMRPAVDVITKESEELSDWIIANRVALVAITKSDLATEKKMLAEQIKASGDSWLIANAERITIANTKLSQAELQLKIKEGVLALTKDDKDLFAFIYGHYDEIREAVKPKLNEAAASGRDKYLADCKAAKEISAAHGNACRKQYAGYKAAEADGTLDLFVLDF